MEAIKKEASKMKVRELKDKLERFGIQIERGMEKSDLVELYALAEHSQRKIQEYELLQTSPEDVVQDIREGQEDATQAYNIMPSTAANDRYRERLVRAGLVDVLLSFLEDCDSQTYQEALPEGSREEYSATPTHWMIALLKWRNYWPWLVSEHPLKPADKLLNVLSWCIGQCSIF